MLVNSFSMFGNVDTWAGAVAVNLRQHYTLYPSWTFWIHTDQEMPNNGYCKVIRKLADDGLLKLTIVPNNGKTYQRRQKCIMMLWRLLPIWDETSYVFCRDLDSILTPRLVQCTADFIRSGRIAHGISDNVSHNIPLMGGMCGFKSNSLKKIYSSLEDMVSHYHQNWDIHGADQTFLQHEVWPQVRTNALLHSLSGPNSRCHLKQLFDVDISHVSQEVRDRGDDFTNYIGAVGTRSDVGSFSNAEIAEFYNKFGNVERCGAITKIEQDLGYTII